MRCRNLAALELKDTEMDEQDAFRCEAAMQYGFEPVGLGKYLRCTEAQLIAFAKVCECKGLDSAKQWVRRELNNPLNDKSKSPLIAAMGAMTKRADKLRAESTPIREAEEARFMTAQGYVRAGARWVKFEPLLCDDEGCPHHGTPHVCNPGKA